MKSNKNGHFVPSVPSMFQACSKRKCMILNDVPSVPSKCGKSLSCARVREHLARTNLLNIKTFFTTISKTIGTLGTLGTTLFYIGFFCSKHHYLLGTLGTCNKKSVV